MELYWLLRLPHLHSLFSFFSFISAAGGVFSMWGAFIFWAEDSKMLRLFFRVAIIFWMLSLLFGVNSCLCPDKTDLALMMGWDAINSESVQDVIEILKDKVK